MRYYTHIRKGIAMNKLEAATAEAKWEKITGGLGKAARLLAKLRDDRNLTQDALAQTIGIDRSLVSRWESTFDLQRMLRYVPELAAALENDEAVGAMAGLVVATVGRMEREAGAFELRVSAAVMGHVAEQLLANPRVRPVEPPVEEIAKVADNPFNFIWQPAVRNAFRRFR